MALKIHPEGSKGLYKDNLSRVVGVKVEIKTAKRIFFKIQGRTRFEDNYSNHSPATAPEMLVGIS